MAIHDPPGGLSPPSPSYLVVFVSFRGLAQRPWSPGLFREYVNGFQIPSHKQSVAQRKERSGAMADCVVGI